MNEEKCEFFHKCPVYELLEELAELTFDEASLEKDVKDFFASNKYRGCSNNWELEELREVKHGTKKRKFYAFPKEIANLCMSDMEFYSGLRNVGLRHNVYVEIPDTCYESDMK